MRTISSNGHGNNPDTHAERESDRLRADIDATHRRLEGLLGELDRRRREAFDVRLQMRRHPAVFAVGAALALGAIGGGTALAIARVRRLRRQRLSPTARVMRLWGLSRQSNVEEAWSFGWFASRAAKIASAILIRRLATRVFMGRRRG